MPRKSSGTISGFSAGDIIDIESDPITGLKTTVMLEVEGAAHYLPAYAGNLDIMTSAALTTADRWAAKVLAKEAA